MTRILIVLSGLLLAPVTLSAPPAHAATAARNYDCTKPGNTNKAVCKKAAATSVAPSTPKARNYDCSKPGNANKAVCKATVAPVAPAAAKTTRNYDCSKAGNANKAACKAAVTTAPAAPSTTYAPRPKPAAPSVAAPAPRGSVSGQNTNSAGPNGATAKCRDGTMSFSAHRSGTCSRHGGVAQWY